MPPRLLRVLHLAFACFSLCQAEESQKDDCLDTWTRQIEEALVACGMPEMQWDQIEMNLMRNQDLLQEVQAALGRNWLPIVLARSKHVLWKGGETVRIDVRASRPAEEPAEEPAPRERSRSRSKISRISSSEIQKPDVSDVQVLQGPKVFPTELRSGASPATLEAPRRDAERGGGASRAASVTGAPKSKAQKTSASPPSPPGCSQGAQDAQGAQGHEGPAVRDAAQGAKELREWLRAADPTGTGKLQKYGDKLTQELDDLTDLLVFVRDESWLVAPSTVDRIDPSFFQCIHCSQAGHKMLLAKAIMKLAAARS